MTEYIEVFDAMERRAVEGVGDPSLHLHAPFINNTKAEIVEIGAALSVPYEATWSCYEGGDPTVVYAEPATSVKRRSNLRVCPTLPSIESRTVFTGEYLDTTDPSDWCPVLLPLVAQMSQQRFCGPRRDATP
jgi:hypothetical protein